MKRKWFVSGSATISVYTVVYAETEEEARELAAEQPVQTFCHYCSTGSPKEERRARVREAAAAFMSQNSELLHRLEEWVTSGEIDAEPQIERLSHEDHE